ncbi:MAG: carbohydrate porin [Planctomycetota bacterium]|nr:carbohydrate porin [Planctomycetota bacterium]
MNSKICDIRDGLRSDSSRVDARSAVALPMMLLALAGTASTARADDPVTSPDVDPTQTSAIAGPQDLPGIEKGARVRKTEEEKKEEAKPQTPPAGEDKPDWFGGKPFWEWQRVTGDWGGLRTKMENAGFTLSASLTMDWSSVWSGGVNKTAHTRTLWDVNLNVDLEKAVGLTGGKVFFDFQSADGRGGAADAGSFQLFSNIETPGNRDQISELWYEQKLFDNVLRVKVGKINAYTEFDFTDAAAGFMNGSAGKCPSIVGIPAYPDPALGAAVFVYPLEQLYIGGGVFDGATIDGISTGNHSPETFFNDDKSSAWFWIGEVGFSWNEVGPLGGGRVAAGAWHHTADFTTFAGNPESSTEGVYALAEQQVWRWGKEGDDAERGAFVFAQGGMTDGDVASAETSFDAGVSFEGICSARPDDGAGFMLSWVDLSDSDNGSGGKAFDNDEWLLEAYYKIQITPFVSVQPDLQYFINPGGSATTDDAWVGSLRFVVSF